ncbi:MAG: ketopantoate reductase family protein [Candidatus Syntropharchaeia archaeon]
MTRIMVMGAGALGSLFGGLLADSGYDVILVGRKKHVDAINKNGLRISGLTDKIIDVKASTTPVDADLILFTVKSYDTEKAARELRIEKDTTVLSLQNGMGNEEKIASIIGEEHVLGGITSYGALFVEPGHIKHTGIADTFIGELNGEITQRAKKICEMFKDAGIKTEITDNIREKIWEKLVINVGINAPTSICRIKNGMLLEIPEMKWIMEKAVEEAVEVAKRMGIKITNPLEKVIDVATKTRENESSMLQDIKKGKRTEIDAINGIIVELGEKFGIPTPVNRTLFSLVKGIEGS